MVFFFNLNIRSWFIIIHVQKMFRTTPTGYFWLSQGWYTCMILATWYWQSADATPNILEFFFAAAWSNGTVWLPLIRLVAIHVYLFRVTYIRAAKGLWMVHFSSKGWAKDIQSPQMTGVLSLGFQHCLGWFTRLEGFPNHECILEPQPCKPLYCQV